MFPFLKVPLRGVLHSINAAHVHPGGLSAPALTATESSTSSTSVSASASSSASQQSRLISTRRSSSLSSSSASTPRTFTSVALAPSTPATSSSSSSSSAAVLSTSSSSSSSSSSFSSSSQRRYGALLAALAALTTSAAVAQQDSAHAEAATAAAPSAEPFLPTIAFQAPKTKPSSVETSRPPLPHPGKFDNMHNEATGIASSQAFAGGRVQLALAPLHWFQTDVTLDRELVVVPIMQATPDGQHGMLNIRTDLGNSHHLEAMMDTNGVSVGKYRYRAGAWSIKPAFQLVPDQEQFTFEVGYKGRECSAQLMVANLAELVLSYNQSLTSKLTAGVQLHTAFPQITFLNFSGRYRFDRGDQVAVSSKNGMWIASYYRPVFSKAATPQYPAQSMSMAAEWRISQKTGQSEVAVGMQHARATFRYHATMASDWSVGMTLEQMLAMGPSLTLSGEMKFDGSGESRFGIGLSHQF